MTRTMYDSVNASHLPLDGDLYLAYIDGRFANLSAVRARFPDKKIVTVTVLGGDADVADCEPGDLTPQTVVAWVHRQRDKGKDPTVYCMASEWATVRANFQKAGVPEPHYFVAKYDNVAQLLPGAVAKQYGGDLPGNFDISIVADFWPGVDVAPPQEDIVQTKVVTVTVDHTTGRGFADTGVPAGKFVSATVIGADDGTVVSAGLAKLPALDHNAVVQVDLHTPTLADVPVGVLVGFNA